MGREDAVLIQALEIISSHAKLRSEEGKEDQDAVKILHIFQRNCTLYKQYDEKLCGERAWGGGGGNSAIYQALKVM